MTLLWILLLLLLLMLAIVIVVNFNKINNVNKVGGGSKDVKDIFIVRHAQTDMNKEGRYYDNHTPEDDIDINETGVNQAIKTGDYLNAYGSFDLIVASSRKRTMHTAELIAKSVGYKKPIITSDLLFETKKGIFNKMTKEEFNAIYDSDEDIKNAFMKYNSIDDPIEQSLYWPTHIKNLDAIRTTKFKETSYAEQCLNYEKFIDWLSTRKEKKIIVVCHSGSEKGLLSLLSGVMPIYLPKPITVDEHSNCTVTYLRYGKSPITDLNRPKYYLVSNTNNLHLRTITHDELMKTNADFIYLAGQSAVGKTTLGHKLSDTVLSVDDIILKHFKKWPKIATNSDKLNEDQQTVVNLIIEEITRAKKKGKVVLEGIMVKPILDAVFRVHSPLIIYMQHVSIDSHIKALTERAIRDINTNFTNNTLGSFWDEPGAKEAIQDYKTNGVNGKKFKDYIRDDAEYKASVLIKRRDALLKDYNYRILYIDLTEKGVLAPPKN